MAIILEDGTGRGNKCRVNDENKLETFAINQNSANFHNNSGNRYNLNTDDTTITNDGESVLLYIKNNESRELVIDAFVIILGASTGGSGDAKGYIYRNPTLGTIISNATPMSIISNLNYGSSNALTADIFKGAQGSTQTNGVKSLTTIMTAGATNVISVGDIVLPKGSSVALGITPPAGNTSMNIHVAALCYLRLSAFNL